MPLRLPTSLDIADSGAIHLFTGDATILHNCKDFAPAHRPLMALATEAGALGIDALHVDLVTMKWHCRLAHAGTRAFQRASGLIGEEQVEPSDFVRTRFAGRSTAKPG
jgi:hypothetical protein